MSESMNLAALLRNRVALHPDRLAYIDGNSHLRLTFNELSERVDRLGNALRAAGIEKGERVGLLLMNSAEFVEAYFALGLVGAVVVPLNWRLVPDELEFILKDSGTKRLIFDEEFLDTVTELHSRGDKTDIKQWLQVEGDVDVADFADGYTAFRNGGAAEPPAFGAGADDMLYIMYTSGTTGLPKGVVHTHRTSFWSALTIASTADYHEGDVFLSPLPMFHVGALTPLTVNIYQGSTSVVMRSFDPTRAWELLEKERVTTALMVPAMLNFMLQVKVPDASAYAQLRWVMSGAAPVPVSLTAAYNDIGIRILEIYGLTETCGPACLMDSEHALAKPGSTGKQFYFTKIKIAGDDGIEVPRGEAGEVWVQGEHVMREYWNRPDATAETLVDGWLRTGDVAMMDEDGFVFIQDRIKDMIISGGENVYPAELENVLMSHPDIAEAAVIGHESEKWGESPFAIVVRTRDDLTEAEVLNHCQGKMAPFKQPKGAAFIDVIPRNPSGKILKRVLREQFPGPAPV
ncbi:MAG: long-chain-fatty-acid--CoA ligase [Pseudomonadota bacterium]